jgi:hypothetical protein
MAKITFAKGDYITFLGKETSTPLGRVVEITEDGNPLVVWFRVIRPGSNFMNSPVKEAFTDSTNLVPAEMPQRDIHISLRTMFQTISAIFPELDNPSATKDEPVEQNNGSPSDHGFNFSEVDD